MHVLFLRQHFKDYVCILISAHSKSPLYRQVRHGNRRCSTLPNSEEEHWDSNPASWTPETSLPDPVAMVVTVTKGGATKDSNGRRVWVLLPHSEQHGGGRTRRALRGEVGSVVGLGAALSNGGNQSGRRPAGLGFLKQCRQRSPDARRPPRSSEKTQPLVTSTSQPREGPGGSLGIRAGDPDKVSVQMAARPALQAAAARGSWARGKPNNWEVSSISQRVKSQPSGGRHIPPCAFSHCEHIPCGGTPCLNLSSQSLKLFPR